MSSGTMERILRLMAEKKASDVYLSAHAPAMIKINGQTIPINSQVLPLEGRSEATGVDRRSQGGASINPAADRSGWSWHASARPRA